MNVQFKKGVLELIVLSLLGQRDYYGFELVSEISRDVQISEGTIYPLLKRLKDEGYLETYLMESPGGPPRKNYRLTPLGEQVRRRLTKEWFEFSASVDRILGGQV